VRGSKRKRRFFNCFEFFDHTRITPFSAQIEFRQGIAGPPVKSKPRFYLAVSAAAMVRSKTMLTDAQKKTSAMQW
jgi:hypothetical protein